MAITFYATNNFTGDGTTVNWNINFADGYIDTTNVKARYLDNTGSYVDIAISSVAGNVVTISPAVANGQEFQIYRDTEKRFPLVDFSDGAILNETNLDTLATQAVMVSAEAFDQSNNGVRIAGDSLVIAQGIDAKAQEALDNSEAAVTTANGIAATAAQALTNSNTAISTANAANSTANGIASTANQALTNSNTAITTANGAVSTADSAAATANAIDGKAQAAIDTANSAVTTANTASTKADTAISTANSAVSTANAIDGKAQTALDNVAALDALTMKKAANLSDIADKAAAWLNVRPIGSTPLAGDPVGDYDAATKRWVENLISTGTVGPTMNGVMNFGVGDFHLRNSRAYKQPYEVFGDGQVLNRADWPELWAYAQMLSPITDAAWLADPQKRVQYSLGNGTTTFRVPDFNGVQAGSIKELFARGDGGNSANNGMAYNAAAPNIVAYTPHTLLTAASSQGQVATDGAFTSTTSTSGVWPVSGGAGLYTNIRMDASQSSPVYGRYGIVDNLIPKNFIGVWVIRASGGFVAANTQWSVINSDTVRPPNGTTVSSGVVSAEYKTGGVIEAQGKVYTAATMGGKYSTQLSVKNVTSGKEKDISVTEDGDLWSDRFKARFGTLMAWSETGSIQGTYSIASQQVGQNYAFNSASSYGQAVDSGYLTTVHHGLIHSNNGSFAQAVWLVAGGANAQYLTRMTIQPNSHDVGFTVSILGSDSFYTLQKSAISDANVKHDIAPGSVDTAWSNLVALQYVTFVYNNDEQARTRRGIIAQQAEVVDPLYVKTITYYKSDGTPVEQKQLDTTPMLLDTMHVVQTLMAKVEALEARIDELTSQ